MTELATQDDTLPPRGSFPAGPQGETTAHRRERYEAWVLSTHSRVPDYEVQSIRFYRGRTKSVSAGPGSSLQKEVPAQPSRRLCVASRCWQCVAGDDDANGQDRIAQCASKRCALWPVRPYQTVEAGRLDYKTAVPAYCRDCMGVAAGGSLAAVKDCTVVNCAVFPARPGAQRAAMGQAVEAVGEDDAE